MPHRKGVLIVLLLLAWSYVARPVYDAALIACGRVADQVRERFAPPLASQTREKLIDLNTTAAREIGDYLTGLYSRDKTAVPVDAETLRERLKTSLAYPPPGLEPATNPGILEEPAGEDDLAVYHRLSIPVLPGVHSTGLYILPKNRVPGRRIPLIIIAHGRGGMPGDTPDHRLPFLTHSNRDLARWAVEDGYAVWLPVFVFYGRGLPEDIRERLTVRAQEEGTTLPAIEIAKTIRAIDVLSTRPEIDASRIGMAGHSYGGFNTLYTTALDLRIKVAVVSAYLNDREEVFESNEPMGFLDWRFPDSLREFRDPAIASLICPRPLLVIAGNQDQLFPVAGARQAAREVDGMYEKAAVGDKFEYFEFTGRHDFNGEAASRFVRKWFGQP